MELIRKSFTTRIKDLYSKIIEDNLFLLSSSVSYYSALAIAPFLLILLGVASLIGGDVQDKVINLGFEISSEVGKMMELIFANVNESLNFGSISGIIGIIVLLWSASLVFLQLRYAMDVIYNYHGPLMMTSIWQEIKKRLFAMLVVVLTGIFLIVSSFLPGLVQWFFSGHEKLLVYKTFAFLINILVYISMFWSIHFFAPSKHPKKTEALKMAFISSLFFVLGNMLLSSYFRSVATGSIYGAAGSLMIFLIWTYYSSFTLFLSVEVFIFIKRIKKLS